MGPSAIFKAEVNMKRRLSIIIILLFLTMSIGARDLSDVNPIDRTFASPYSATLDNVGTLLAFGSMATAGALFLENNSRSDLLTIGTMYAETMTVAYATKELLKDAFHRARPYLYFPSYPMEEEDWFRSMPSGHTVLAFAGASFTSLVFSRYNPDSRLKVPVTIASYSLATLSAISRVDAGCHFPTDVLVGAAIGTVIGLGIPLLHTIGTHSNMELEVSPFRLAFRKQF